MTNEEKLKDPSTHLLIITLGKFFKKNFGGTTERSETLAAKMIEIMDNK